MTRNSIYEVREKYKKICDINSNRLEILEYILTIINNEEDITYISEDGFYINFEYRGFNFQISENHINFRIGSITISEFILNEIDKQHINILSMIINHINTKQSEITKEYLNEKILIDKEFAKLIIPKIIDHYNVTGNLSSYDEIRDDITEIIKIYYPELICPVHNTLHRSSWCLKQKLENC